MIDIQNRTGDDDIAISKIAMPNRIYLKMYIHVFSTKWNVIEPDKIVCGIFSENWEISFQ